MIWLLLACDDAPGEAPPAEPTPVTAACGSWRSVGQPFVLTYCTGCHAEGVPDRHGAPAGVDLDSLANVRDHATRLRARVGAGMPPGGGPAVAEIDRLNAWLDCGAPGDEATLPSGESAGTGLAGVWEARVTRDGDELLVESGAEWTGALNHREWYRVTPDAAEFVGWARYDADGDVIRGVTWEPPLPVWGASGVVAARATVQEGDATSTVDEEWTVTLGTAAEVDPRAQDPAPRQSLAVEAGGETWEWQFSAEAGFVLRRHTRGDRALTLLRQEIGPPPAAGEGFPVAEGLFWPDRVVGTEEAP